MYPHAFPSVAVPPPLPSIIASRGAPLYAATSFSLTCDYTLDALVDTTLSVVVSWTLNGSAVDISPNRITTPDTSLVFNPLATSDSGSYMCEVTVLQDYVTAEESGESSLVAVVIEGRQK